MSPYAESGITVGSAACIGDVNEGESAAMTPEDAGKWLMLALMALVIWLMR